MAPAPKARIQKGHIVGSTDNAAVHAPEDHLIDLSEDRPQIAKHLTNGESGSRSESPATAAFGTSPKTTFIRRGSGGADGNLVSIRGNVNDMREHLKHLGPSNLASRPKTTRYNSVKIKQQGPSRSDSRTDSNLHRDSIIDEDPYEDIQASPAPHGGEGEGLLKSAGKEASDGVQALQQGYGTLDRRSKESSEPHQAKDGPTTSATEAPKSSPPQRRLIRVDSDRSSDTIKSLNSQEHSPTRRKRGTARSGSITENIIEAGGVRKVVLETNSSSSDDRDDRAPTTSRRAQKNSPPNMDRPPSYSGSADTPAAPKGEEVKKKRRRTRKKKGGKSSDESALLEVSSNQ
jgi:metal transporter CNNM